MLISELYKIRYLLILELFLLLVFALFELVPFLISLSMVVLGVLVYLSFKSSLFVILILMFSILADSFMPIKGSTSGFSLSLLEVFFTFSFVIASIKLLMDLKLNYTIPPITLIWLLFLIWSLVTGVIVAIDSFRVISFWKNYFAGFFVFTFLYFSINNKYQISILLKGVILWGLILALLEFKVLWELGGFTTGIVGLFLKKNLLTLGWGRSNYLAAFFVLIIPLTIGYLLYTESKRVKLLLTFILISMSFAMILTLSRGGILALIIALVILSIKVLKPSTLLPFLSVIIIIIIILLLNPLTFVLFQSLGALETSGSVYTRINFYSDIWTAFLRNPVVGVGFGNLGYYAQFVIPYRDAPAAHNIILGALGEVGLVGSFLYFSIFALLIQKIYSHYKIETDEKLNFLRWCIISSLLGGLAHSLVEPTFDGLQFSIIFWTISGIAVKLNLMKDSELNTNL